MKKQLFERVMVVNVLDQPDKVTGKVFPKVVVCSDFGDAARIGIKLEEIGKYKAAIGQRANLVVAVWTKQTRDGRPFDTYQMDSFQLLSAARAA